MLTSLRTPLARTGRIDALIGWHDHDRHGAVTRALVADRAEQDLANAAVTSGADDQQVGRGGGSAENLGWVAYHDGRVDKGIGLAERVRDGPLQAIVSQSTCTEVVGIVGLRLRRGPQGCKSKRAGHAGICFGSAANEARLEDGPPARRLDCGPAERPERPNRSVDAYENPPC